MTDVDVTTEAATPKATETKEAKRTCIECGAGMVGNGSHGWCPPCYSKNYRNRLRSSLKALKEEVDKLRIELTKVTAERDIFAGLVKR